MSEIIEQLKMQLAAFGPNLLAGIAILVIGWLIALLASYLTRKCLEKPRSTIGLRNGWPARRTNPNSD